jgi:hypothetical protein
MSVMFTGSRWVTARSANFIEELAEPEAGSSILSRKTLACVSAGLAEDPRDETAVVSGRACGAGEGGPTTVRSEPWKGREGIFTLAVEEHWATLDPYSVALAMIGLVPRPATITWKEGLR